MQIYQFIILTYYAINILITILKHNKLLIVTPASLIESIFILIVLILGGFFSTLGIPQMIYILIWTLSLGFGYINCNEIVGVYNFYYTTIVTSMILFIYWWGGFFT